MLAERGRLLLAVGSGLLAGELSRSGDRGAGGERTTRGQQRAARVRAALERLGPLYVKVGQVLSTREDLVPPAVAGELAGLHDRVPPCAFEWMSPVLEAELGRAWRQRFQHFDSQNPLGCASLAQVYAATLSDGRPVVVKVQRPGITSVMAADMRLLRLVTRVLSKRFPLMSETIDFHAMVSVVFEAVRQELDFTLEAANMDEARRTVGAVPGIRIPDVVHATPRVLIQQRAPGTSIRDADPAAFAPEERERIGTGLLAFMYQGYFIDHRFHADPHPGNVFVCPGGPTTLIDWGMVGRIDRHVSSSLMMTLLGLANNDAHAVARSWAEMGRPTPWADLSGFEQDMSTVVPKLAAIPLSRLRFGASLAELLRHSTRRGIQTNPMIGLLGKSFANAEGTVRCIAPELSAVDVLADQADRVLLAHARTLLSQRQLSYSALQAIAAVETLLPHTRAVGRNISAGELTVQRAAVTRPFSLVAHRANIRSRRFERRVLTAAALAWYVSRHIGRR
ncbi:ABC1 kinase family protein [Streptomyces qinglanensis]|uniref:Ubiquinone biosynthesis protein n=1 Tax=Streptomyces qinglanensis TaxID=943816 RepID=A0A1H9TF62_9ACTN|nr:AarF/UbiB family protein [Streptomyces qinglanensis]SER95980.1 ubiquinone biosynthesis protein [Streptomyces qinglanensis]